MRITLLGTSHGDPTRTCNQTSSLIECGGKLYLIDAGEGAAAGLVRRNMRAAMLSEIFITHMHVDHTNGLAVLAEQAHKYRKSHPETALTIHLPESRGEAALRQWLTVTGYPVNEDTAIKTIAAGKFFDDGVLQVEAFPTKHMAWASHDDSLPSYAFLVSAEGKKVLFTGDLRGDFTDFPVDAAKRADIVVCEMVHFKPEYALPIFRELKLKHLVFNHLSNYAQTTEGQTEIGKLCRDLQYPFTFGFDGYTFAV